MALSGVLSRKACWSDWGETLKKGRACDFSGVGPENRADVGRLWVALFISLPTVVVSLRNGGVLLERGESERSEASEAIWHALGRQKERASDLVLCVCFGCAWFLVTDWVSLSPS